jgi:hypothetical protein
MIALSVSLNGKHICTAGAEDLAVLSTIITATGKLGKKTVPARPNDLHGLAGFSIGGLARTKNSKKNVHMSWATASRLKVGDTIQVTILETIKVDKPIQPKKVEKQKKRGS